MAARGTLDPEMEVRPLPSQPDDRRGIASNDDGVT